MKKYDVVIIGAGTAGLSARKVVSKYTRRGGINPSYTHIPFGNGTAYRGQGNQLAELVFIGIGIERHRFSKGDF